MRTYFEIALAFGCVVNGLPVQKISLSDSNFKALLNKAGSQQAAESPAAPSAPPQPAAGGSAAPAPAPAPASGQPTTSQPAAGTGAAAPSGQSATSSSPSGAPAASSSASSSPSGGASGGKPDKVPSYEQFKDAVAAYAKTGNGAPPAPSKELYDAYVKSVGAMPIKEQAMFITNCIWETGGLQYMKEIACSNGSCTYGKYYGRGFLQLTWDYNYKAASKDLYGDENVLLSNPDKVATPEGAWSSAMWFWNKNVSPALKSNNAVESNKLGYAVKVINGALECPANDKAKKRLQIYNEILSKWSLGGTGTLDGC